jgi:hypothetical protein
MGASKIEIADAHFLPTWTGITHGENYGVQDNRAHQTDGYVLRARPPKGKVEATLSSILPNLRTCLRSTTPYRKECRETFSLMAYARWSKRTASQCTTGQTRSGLDTVITGG